MNLLMSHVEILGGNSIIDNNNYSGNSSNYNDKRKECRILCNVGK